MGERDDYRINEFVTTKSYRFASVFNLIDELTYVFTSIGSGDDFHICIIVHFVHLVSIGLREKMEKIKITQN